MNFEHWTLNIEHWTLNIEHWILNIEHRLLNIEHWTLNIEHWTLNIELAFCIKYVLAYEDTWYTCTSNLNGFPSSWFKVVKCIYFAICIMCNLCQSYNWFNNKKQVVPCEYWLCLGNTYCLEVHALFDELLSLLFMVIGNLLTNIEAIYIHTFRKRRGPVLYVGVIISKKDIRFTQSYMSVLPMHLQPLSCSP